MTSSRETQSSSMQEPWAPSQPYFKQLMGDTQNVYESGQGFSYYPGSTVVPFSNQSVQAMQGIEDLAGQGNPLATAASQNAQSVLESGGISPEQRAALQSNLIPGGKRSIKS